MSQVIINIPWLYGWSKRVQVTIDHTLIDSDLTNFPVLLHIGSSSGRQDADTTFIFNELQNDNNRRKIAVTTGDGETQCYVEVEKWDTAGENAWIWIKVPSISSTEDTILYLYYDADQPDNTDYVGDIGSIPAQNVWTGWTTLTHMAQSGNEVDSKDGSGSYVQTGFVSAVTGVIGNARASSNGDSNYLSKVAFNDPRPITIIVWAHFDSAPVSYSRVFSREQPDSTGLDFEWGPGTSYRMRWWVGSSFDSVSAIPSNTWTFIAATFNNGVGKIYLNGTLDRTNSQKDKDCSAYPLYLFRSGKGTGRYMNGRIDEFRIYPGELDSAWIKAEYESQRDNLLSWGEEENFP
ncbi:MAG: DUF2341 domain-containing protein [Candidatus Bathyarchaeia archaeon]